MGIPQSCHHREFYANSRRNPGNMAVTSYWFVRKSGTITSAALVVFPRTDLFWFQRGLLTRARVPCAEFATQTPEIVAMRRRGDRGRHRSYTDASIFRTGINCLKTKKFILNRQITQIEFYSDLLKKLWRKRKIIIDPYFKILMSLKPLARTNSGGGINFSKISTLESDSNARAKWKESESSTAALLPPHMVKTISLAARLKNETRGGERNCNQKKFTLSEDYETAPPFVRRG